MIINNINSFEDSRGSLMPIEFKDIPFEVKRMFVVNNVPINCIRGGHAHFKTKQLIICINGSIDVILHNGVQETKWTIYKNEMVLVPELIWDSQKFNEINSEILVLCSTIYDKSDYILNFDDFLKIKQL